MINKEWDVILKEEFNKDYFKALGRFIKNEYKTKTVFPNYDNIFNSLRYTDYDQIKVVIIGQDPYHGDNEAHGLAFSVLDGVRRPPSLNNIYKELSDDLGIKRESNNLSDWAKQGVLLLNTIMTVEKDKPLSHANKGWEIFTDNIISQISKREKPVVFILWGNFARSKKQMIDSRHFIIESAHPSPLSASRGFFGSKPFSKANVWLEKQGYEKIKW